MAQVRSLHPSSTVVCVASGFEDKLRAIQADGPKRLRVVSDFDCTLTYHRLDGISAGSSAAFRRSGIFGEEYNRRSTEMANKYRAFETDTSLDRAEWSRLMEEWVLSIFRLKLEYGLSLVQVDWVANIVRSCLRPGVIDFVRRLDAVGVPVTILSAGWGDVIQRAFGLWTLAHLDVIANRYVFDGHRVVGLSQPVIHPGNKSFPLLLERQKMGAEAENVVLLGDSLPDARMVEDGSFHHVIRVGFLNGREESRSQYEKAYDVVIDGDGCVCPVRSLFDCLLG